MKKSSQIMVDVFCVTVLVWATASFLPLWSYFFGALAGIFFAGFIKDVYELGKEKNTGSVISEDNLPRDIYEIINEIKFDGGQIVILRNKNGELTACKSIGKYFTCFDIRKGFLVPADLVSFQQVT